MNNKIIINIVGEQLVGDEINRTEFITEGRYSEENGKKRLEYDESMMVGEEGSITSIEYDGDTVSLMRTGSTFSHMVFRAGEKCLNHFSTEYGDVQMGVYPLHVKCDMDSNKGELDLTYQLDISGTYASLNQLKVSYSLPKN
jgi:uncharacterized beta-barrel protein YwiB (DUF1934 family)